MATATENESTLAQLARAKTEAKLTAKTGEGGSSEEETELPQGAAPLEARAEEEETSEETPEVTASAGEEPTGGEEPAVAAEDDGGEETLIRIGDKEFKTTEDAVRYAEELEYQRNVSDAYAQGIRDTLGTKGLVPEEKPAPEEDLETEFYTDPKGTLGKIKDRATQDAVAIVRAEMQRERLWETFSEKYPEIRRKDAERILGENSKVLNAMPDLDKAMERLAVLTRKEYAEIAERMKPRVMMEKKPAQATQRGGGVKPSVTPKEKEEAPLAFTAQVRKLRGQG